MLRSDSVIWPEACALSRTMVRWTVRIRWLSRPVNPAMSATPIPKTGISSQFFVTPYQTMKPMPTVAE